MIRILLADDHEVLRTAIRRLMADVPDFEVVTEAASGPEAVEAVRRNEIDVAIVDVTMPGADIVTTIHTMRSISPRTRIVVLSAHPAEQYALRVLRAGASGYVMKHEPWTEVVAAVRKASAGGRHVTPALAEALAATMWPSAGGSTELSDREMQVLERMAQGLSPAEIAGQLNISPKTVHTFRSRLLRKLGLRTNADLIRYALENHFTE